MGILKGALTVRRYHVEGDVPDDFRDVYRDAFQDHAFRERPQAMIGEEAIGWCQVHNLLDTDFSDLNRWLYNHYVLAALRVDKKMLPAKLFKAHLEKRIQAWCEANSRTKAPKSVKEEIKEALEIEMLNKTLPRVATTEFCWNIVDRWVVVHSTSDKVNDDFRKLFRGTFGLVTTPVSPLDLVADNPQMAGILEVAGISDYRPRSSDAGDHAGWQGMGQ
jgi:DNA recombination-dependent growth factor C